MSARVETRWIAKVRKTQANERTSVSLFLIFLRSFDGQIQSLSPLSLQTASSTPGNINVIANTSLPLRPTPKSKSQKQSFLHLLISRPSIHPTRTRFLILYYFFLPIPTPALFIPLLLPLSQTATCFIQSMIFEPLPWRGSSLAFKQDLFTLKLLIPSCVTKHT